MGEHRFVTVRYPVRTSDYPGEVGSYAAAELICEERVVAIGDKYLEVHLPAADEIVLDLEMDRYANQPSYALPWSQSG